MASTLRNIRLRFALSLVLLAGLCIGIAIAVINYRQWNDQQPFIVNQHEAMFLAMKTDAITDLKNAMEVSDRYLARWPNGAEASSIRADRLRLELALKTHESAEKFRTAFLKEVKESPEKNQIELLAYAINMIYLDPKKFTSNDFKEALLILAKDAKIFLRVPKEFEDFAYRHGRVPIPEDIGWINQPTENMETPEKRLQRQQLFKTFERIPVLALRLSTKERNLDSETYHSRVSNESVLVVRREGVAKIELLKNNVVVASQVVTHSENFPPEVTSTAGSGVLYGDSGVYEAELSARELMFDRLVTPWAPLMVREIDKDKERQAFYYHCAEILVDDSTAGMEGLNEYARSYPRGRYRADVDSILAGSGTTVFAALDNSPPASR